MIVPAPLSDTEGRGLLKFDPVDEFLFSFSLSLSYLSFFRFSHYFQYSSTSPYRAYPTLNRLPTLSFSLKRGLTYPICRLRVLANTLFATARL